MKKGILTLIMMLITIINLLLPVVVYGEGIDENALELFLNKLASMSESKREFGALILEEYLKDGDKGIYELKEVIDTISTDDQKEELEKYGYTIDDVKEELDRLKKWSMSDRMKLIDYIKDGDTEKLEELILSYESNDEDEEVIDEGDSEGDSIPSDNEAPSNLATETEVSDIEFTDIDGHWAKDSIEFLAGKGIISGKGDNTFDPEGNITRAEFTALVVRLFNLQSQNTENLHFTDVGEDQWYYSVIKSAYENGIIDGVNEKEFLPNNSINREQMVAIIIRVLEGRGILSQLEVVNKDIGLYTDKEEISPWAVDSIAKALRYGIISGRSEDILAPKGNTTRAEAATIIKKLYDILN